MSLLADLAAASARVSETSSRLEKTRELAACLRSVEPDEIPIAIAYLSGETCQGKLGVSHAALQSAHAVAPAMEARLTLPEVDTAFAAIAQTKGKGASARRSDQLGTLLVRATAAEQDFLVRPENGGFVMLGKTFKGLTDEMLKWQTEEFLKRQVSRDDWVVYLRPELVVEIAFNEIQESSQYPGGLALRFARVKGYRPDKRADEADTIDTVRKLYSSQVHAGGPL